MMGVLSLSTLTTGGGAVNMELLTVSPLEQETGLVSSLRVTEESQLAAIEPPVEQRQTRELFYGESRILQMGEAGVSMQTDRVTRRDGEEIARRTLFTEILSPATPTIVEIGISEPFLWPCWGQLTSYFGERYIFGTVSFHSGLDIASGWGTTITASAAGQVTFAGEQGTYGNLVKIDHQNGYVTYYAHCDHFFVQEGNWVLQGDAIAAMGSTGRSTGPHCHFEIRKQGEPLDPLNFLP